uniref:SUEL-type lectin domain-containing protein n=1 Tax=Ciona savignyi TaxID=51511 RepID=H2YX35_CIOSA
MGYVTDRCHRQRRCTIPVPRHLCGNYVHVEYSCVPEVVLTRHLPSPNLSMVHSTGDVINELSNVTSSTTILLPTTTREAVIIPKLAAVPQLSTGTTSSRTTIVDSAITSQTSLVVTSSTDLASHDVTTVLPIIATVTPTKREATQNTVVIQPTSAVRESSIEAVNEFPLSGFGQKGVTTAGNQSSTTGGASSKTPMSDVEIATVGDAGAATSTGFMFIRSIAALVIFIRENSDQVLIIFLASISSGLFLTVCVLLCRRGDFPSITKKKKKETQPHREDSASLLGNRETSQQSRT